MAHVNSRLVSAGAYKGCACSQAFNDASRGLEAKYQLAQTAREKTRANIDAKIRAMDIIKRDLEVSELDTDNTKAEQASITADHVPPHNFQGAGVPTHPGSGSSVDRLDICFAACHPQNHVLSKSQPGAP